MAHVAAGKKTEGGVLDRAGDLLDLAKNFIKDHKNGTIAALAIGGAGTALPFVLPAIANASGTNGPVSERTLALLGNDRIKELRAELLTNENNLINQRHSTVASLVKNQDMPLYATGGKVLTLDRQLAYVNEALNIAVRTVNYQPNAGGANGVIDVVNQVLDSHGVGDTSFRRAAARVVMTYWYALNADTKTRPTYPNLDTVEIAKTWAANQVPPVGDCSNHADNLELHFKVANLLPKESGVVVGSARPIWEGKSPNTSPLNEMKNGNHRWVAVNDCDDAGTSRYFQYDAYWLAPVAKTLIGPDGRINFKNHYYAAPNTFSDPWMQVLCGVFSSTHYAFGKDEYVEARINREKFYPPHERASEREFVRLYDDLVKVPFLTIQDNRCVLPYGTWTQFNMTPAAAAVQDFNSQRR